MTTNSRSRTKRRFMPSAWNRNQRRFSVPVPSPRTTSNKRRPPPPRVRAAWRTRPCTWTNSPATASAIGVKTRRSSYRRGSQSSASRTLDSPLASSRLADAGPTPSSALSITRPSGDEAATSAPAAALRRRAGGAGASVDDDDGRLRRLDGAASIGSASASVAGSGATGPRRELGRDRGARCATVSLTGAGTATGRGVAGGEAPTPSSSGRRAGASGARGSACSEGADRSLPLCRSPGVPPAAAAIARGDAGAPTRETGSTGRTCAAGGLVRLSAPARPATTPRGVVTRASTSASALRSPSSASTTRAWIACARAARASRPSRSSPTTS